MDRMRHGEELGERHGRDGRRGRDAGLGEAESPGAGVRAVWDDRGVGAEGVDGHQKVIAECVRTFRERRRDGSTGRRVERSTTRRRWRVSCGATVERGRQGECGRNRRTGRRTHVGPDLSSYWNSRPTAWRCSSMEMFSQVLHERLACLYKVGHVSRRGVSPEVVFGVVSLRMGTRSS